MHQVRVLVSGGSGFIGAPLLQSLRDDGASVSTLGRNDSAPVAALRHFALGAAPWTEQQWGEVIQAVEPQLVFHLAGAMHGDEVSLFDANCGSAEGLFAALERCGGPYPVVVVAGSATEYGASICDGVPVSEDLPCKPLSAYGRSKVAQTLALLEFGQRTGARVVSARIFNPIGVGMPEHLALASFVTQVKAIRGAGKLVTGNLDVWRDQIHVNAAAAMLSKVAMHPEANGVVNICSGVSFHLKETVDYLIASSGKQVELAVDPKRVRTEIGNIVGSVERLRLLGIEPPVPDMHAVVDELLAAGAVA